jgi:hypothetical protein
MIIDKIDMMIVPKSCIAPSAKEVRLLDANETNKALEIPMVIPNKKQ